MNRLRILAMAILLFVLPTMAITVVLAQSTTSDVVPNNCPERYSVFENGVLIYECEIVDRNGVFTVAERDRNGTVVERPATTLEISSYTAAIAERECNIRKQSARIELATPISRLDITALAERIIALEAAIAECVQ